MNAKVKKILENQSAIVYLLDDKNYAKRSGSVLKTSLKAVYGRSKWQFFNPLNVLEAIALIPANAADRACLWGMPRAADAQSEQASKSIISADASTVNEEDSPLPLNPPPRYIVSKRRKWLRAGVNLLVRIPHKLIQPLTSPRKFFFEPMSILRKQHPKWFTAVILGTLLLAAFIIVSLFTAGLPGFMLALGLGAAHAGVALAGATGLGIAAAVIIAKIAIVAFTVLTGGKLLQVLATEAAGLQQYHFAKGRSEERLFEETKQPGTAEQEEVTADSVQLLAGPAEHFDFNDCIKQYDDTLAYIKKGYPNFKVKTDYNPTEQNKAFIGFLLKKQWKIDEEQELEDYANTIFANPAYALLTSELKGSVKNEANQYFVLVFAKQMSEKRHQYRIEEFHTKQYQERLAQQPSPRPSASSLPSVSRAMEPSQQLVSSAEQASPALENKQEDKETLNNNSAEVLSQNALPQAVFESASSLQDPCEIKHAVNKGDKKRKKSSHFIPQFIRNVLSYPQKKAAKESGNQTKKPGHEPSASEPVKSSSNQTFNDYKFDKPPHYVADLRELLGGEDKFCKEMAEFAVVLIRYLPALITVEKAPKPTNKKHRSKGKKLDAEVQKLKDEAENIKNKVAEAVKKISNLKEIPNRFSFMFRKDNNEQLKIEIKEAEWSNNVTEQKELTLIERNCARFNVLKQNPFSELGEWQAINADNFDAKLNQLIMLFNGDGFLDYFSAMASITFDYSELIDLLTRFAAEQGKKFLKDVLEMFSGVGNRAILPVQRLMRYVLHIKDLRKDYEAELGSSDALEKLETFVESITGMANCSADISGSSIRRAHSRQPSMDSEQSWLPALPRAAVEVNLQTWTDILTQSMQQGGILSPPSAAAASSRSTPSESPRAAAMQ